MAAVVVANLADLCTFLLVVQLHPISGESNPIIAPLWAVSPWTIVLLKAAGVCISLLILGHAHPRIRRIGIVLAVLVPILGTLSNTMSGLL